MRRGVDERNRDRERVHANRGISSYYKGKEKNVVSYL